MATPIVIPRLGWSMDEGTFVGWLKQDGDPVRAGDPLFELEGEKALQEIEAVETGLLRIAPDAPQPGAIVAVGRVLGYVLAAGEQTPWESGEPPSAPTSASSPAIAAPLAAASVHPLAREWGDAWQAVAETGAAGRVHSHGLHQAAAASAIGTPVESRRSHASPRARRVAAELGVDWTTLRGSGRNGRVRERDVRQAALNLGQPGSGHAASRSTRSELISPRRRMIAERMLASWRQTAPVTLTSRADVTSLVSLRNQMKSAGELALIPTWTDIVAKLAAVLLQRQPLLSGRWCDDRIELPDETGFHIGIAVDTDAGLLVPVLRDVARRPLLEIAADARRLIHLARAGRLPQSDMQGGVFTITNLGAFGIDVFTPIINSPETAILGLGAIRREPIFAEAGHIEAVDWLTLSLTFDHRLIDGAPAARFLQSLCHSLVNPSGWMRLDALTQS